MAERQALDHAISISRRDIRAFTEPAAAPGTFGLQQMALARMGAQNLASRCYFEAFGYRLLGLNPFRASHKSFFLKRARNIDEFKGYAQQVF